MVLFLLKKRFLIFLHLFESTKLTRKQLKSMKELCELHRYVIPESGKKQTTKFLTAEFRKIVSSKLYHIENSDYRKNSKIWDTSNNCNNCPKNRKV